MDERNTVQDWERSVIATAVTEPSSIEEAADLLPADFTGAHQIAWAEILAMHQHGGVDVRALTNALRSSPDFTRLSGGENVDDYIREVLTFRGTNMRTYVDMVIDKSTRRTLRRHIALIATEAENNEKRIAEILDFAEDKILSLRRNRTDEGYTIQDLIATFVPRMEAQIDGTVQPAWAPKLQAVRDVVDYLEPEDFMTIAARPGEGKSSYMRYEFLHAAMAGQSVGILNYENAPIEYLRYFIGILTGIDTRKLKQVHGISEREREQIREAVDTLSRLRIKIDTTPRTAAAMLRAARKMVARDDITLLGVDYLQLINNGSDNRATDLALTTGELRRFAMEYKTPVIANAQLSREIERRPKNENGEVEPELSDLRESGAIEQDATIVMFPRPMRSPSANILALFPENRDGLGRVLDRPVAIPTYFYVKKNRNGNSGTTDAVLWLKHNGHYRTLERGSLPR